MRICIQKSTGRVLEAQSHALEDTLIGNLVSAGFDPSDLEEIVDEDPPGNIHDHVRVDGAWVERRHPDREYEDLKAEMDQADLKVVRAIVDGDSERVAEHRAAQGERRLKLRALKEELEK